MSVIVGALGSVIGYLGAEAATESFFERLLWPERFYNDATISIILKMAILMPMTGPLHGAALKSLDTFRAKGLYLGMRRGDMLGTTFLHDTRVKNYRIPSADEKEEAKESRNAFWVQVLREVKCENRKTRLSRRDSESTTEDHIPPYRAMQLVHHLKLRHANDADHAGLDAIKVTEASISWRTLAGILASELTSIAIGITVAFAKPFKTWWVAVYLCVPLLLKVFSLFVSVRRDSIKLDENATQEQPEYEDDLYEIEDPNQGFAIIQGPESIVRQFFRHYGHPKRDSGAEGRRDRARELLSMGLVYVFVLYFPAGLISSLWMKQNVQILWLSFQLYTIVAMHVVRILGWDGCGRTEGRIARYLQRQKTVWLTGLEGYGVVARLETRGLANVARAKEEVTLIVKEHHRTGAVGPDGSG